MNGGGENPTRERTRVEPEPYFRLPLKDAAEAAALLELLRASESETLKPVLERLISYAKTV